MSEEARPKAEDENAPPDDKAEDAARGEEKGSFLQTIGEVLSFLDDLVSLLFWFVPRR